MKDLHGTLKENPEFIRNLKEHQKKLLSLLRYIQNDQLCRLRQVYLYFGYKKDEDCGICDVCR
jgi:ATP-dependent DNA helicase RecQ